MADKPDDLTYLMQGTGVSQTRPQLAEFLPSLRAIKAFENLYQQVNKVIPSALNRVVYEVKEQKFGIDVKNADSVTLPLGTVVVVTAAGPGGQGTEVQRAELTDSLPVAGLGVVHGNDIAVNGYGYFVAYGNVAGMDTSAWTPGDVLYLDPNESGKLTNVRPVLPDRAIVVAKCVSSDDKNGEIFVMLTEDTDSDINSLGGVVITNPVTGDVLAYDDTINAWKNTSVDSPAALEARIAALEQLLADYVGTDLSVYSNGTTVRKIVLAKDIPQP